MTTTGPSAAQVRARDLCAAHLGAEVRLPGDPDNHWSRLHTIIVVEDGINLRRDDDPIPVTLSMEDLVAIRAQHQPSGLDEALMREANLREELEDAWAKCVSAATPGARITDGVMPAFIPADWTRAILDSDRADFYDVFALSGRVPAAEVMSTIVQVLLHHDWAAEEDPNLSAAHDTHHYDGRCAVCRRQFDRVATEIVHRLDDLIEPDETAA